MCFSAAWTENWKELDPSKNFSRRILQKTPVLHGISFLFLLARWPIYRKIHGHIASYLYSLIRVAKQGYQHIKKKDDCKDKKGSVEDLGNGIRRKIHGRRKIGLIWLPKQRPAQVSDHRPPTAKKDVYTTWLSKYANLTSMFLNVYNSINFAPREPIFPPPRALEASCTRVVITQRHAAATQSCAVQTYGTCSGAMYLGHVRATKS